MTSAGTSDLVVTAANYGWRAGDWVHIIMQWDDSFSLANQQQLYVNGLQPAHTDPTVGYNSALLTLDTDFYVGNISGDRRPSPTASTTRCTPTRCRPRTPPRGYWPTVA